MAINYNTTVPTSNPVYLPKNAPLDIKQEVASLSNVKDIQYPYIGMIFFAKSEGTHHVVKTLANGYIPYATNILQSTRPAGTEYTDYETVTNAFIGTYAALSTGSSGGGSGSGLTVLVQENVTDTTIYLEAQYPNATVPTMVIDSATGAMYIKYATGSWIKTEGAILTNALPTVAKVTGANVLNYK